jgi:hypothetical protein
VKGFVEVGRLGFDATEISPNFHIHDVLLDIIKVFYSPTDPQVNCLKTNFKIYIKIDIKSVSTSIGAITIIREHIIRSC